MAIVGELELPGLDYTDPSLRGERFHEAMRELRAQGWLASGPYGYVVLDRESGEHFLRTREAIFPGMTIAEIFDVREGPLFEQMKRNILHVNGPDHTRLRSLVNPALSARALARHRPAMREFLERLFADACAAGRGSDGVVKCEFVEAFAKPYPSQAIALVMGAPVEDAPRLHHWSNWIQRQFDAASMAGERDGIEQAVKEFYEYARALVAARREDPRDDLISKLIAATLPEPPEGGQAGAGGERAGAGGDGANVTGEGASVEGRAKGAARQRNRLSDVECINLVFNVLVGGVDTTQSQLAHAIRLLAERPEQWELLRREPDLAERAVEEALRYEPITPFTARITTADVTFRDVTFPAGTVVMVCAFTANRDLKPGEGEPEEFDIAADRGKARALTFGAGIHNCVGANLARLELKEALKFLAERMPKLELDGEPEYETITGIYGLARLPIKFSL
ncbi:MAG TPA: cytochrome P450 [Solirubrobacteraceae bacterium]|nr:cytochrome P450 [Solirubrobacteraceae bacterium]